MGINKTCHKTLPFVGISKFVLLLLLSVRFWSHLGAVFVSFRFRVVPPIRTN